MSYEIINAALIIQVIYWYWKINEAIVLLHKIAKNTKRQADALSELVEKFKQQKD